MTEFIDAYNALAWWQQILVFAWAVGIWETANWLTGRIVNATVGPWCERQGWRLRDAVAARHERRKAER